MKTPVTWSQGHRLLCIVLLSVGWSAISLGAPPPKVEEEEPNVLRRVGNFLFKKTRQFEKSQDPGKPVPPPRSATGRPLPPGAGTPTRGRSLDAPPAGTPGYYGPASSTGGSGTTATATGRKRTGTQSLQPGDDSTGGDPSKPNSETKSVTDKPASRTEAPEVQGPPAPLSYATPVLGRPGFVYPPGAEKLESNMLDVRGLNPGQKARDPRTGSMFLVP